MSEKETMRKTRQRAREEFAQRHPLRQVNVGGIEWSYIAGGRGDTTILWLHGAAGDAYQVQRFVEPLAEKARFVAPTVPAVDRLQNVYRGLDAILAEQKTDRLIVAGGSFGGLLAQAFARERAEQLDGLMLFDTSAPDAERAKINRRKMAVLRYLPWPFLRWLFAKSLGRLLRVPGETTESQRLELSLAAEQFRETFRRLTKERLLAHSALAHEFLASDCSAGGWTGPTLVIRSKDDPSQKGLAGPESLYPEVRTIEIEGVGHLGSLLRRDDYLTAFREFIDARSAGGLSRTA